MGAYISNSEYEPVPLANNPLPGFSAAEMRRRAESTIGAESYSYCERQCVIRKPLHREAVTCLAQIRPGIVLSGGRDSMIALSNIDTNECIRQWHGHQKEVTRLAYRGLSGASTTNTLLSGSRDTTIKSWDFRSANATHTFEGHEFVVTGLQILNDNKFVSGSRDNTIRLWDKQTGQQVAINNTPQNMVTFLSKSKSDTFVAQSSEDKTVKIWDARDLTLIHTFPRKQQIQLHCDVSKDENYVLSSSNGFNGNGCEISLWDMRTRKLLREFRGHEENVNCAIFMNQQVTWKKLILSVSNDHTVKLWHMDDGTCLWSEFIPSGGDLTAATAFNDGNVVVAGLNACLCYLRLLGRAGKPLLHCLSMQVLPTTSTSAFAFD